MSRFVVETTEETPVILVIGEEGGGVRLLDQGLLQKNLQISVVSPDEVVKTPTLLQKDWAKVFWVIGDVFDFSRRGVEVAQLLRGAHDVVVVATFPLLLKSSAPELQNWARRSEQTLRFLHEIQRTLPQAQFFFGEGVIEHDFFREIEVVTSTKQPNCFLDPGVDFSFCRMSSFVERVLSLAFRPHVHTLLVSGEEGCSEGWIQGWQTKIRSLGKEIQVIKPTQSSKRIELPFEKNTIREGGLREEIQQMVGEAYIQTQTKFFPLKQDPQIKTPTTTQIIQRPAKSEERESQYRVVKTIPPKIENRLRRYNERMEAVKQRASIRRPRLAQRRVGGVERERPPVWSLSQLTHVEKDIHRVFTTARVAQKTTRVQQQAQRVVTQSTKNTRRKILFQVAAVLVTIGVFVGGLIGAFIFPSLKLRDSVFQTLGSLAQNNASEWLQNTAELRYWERFVEPQINAYESVLGGAALEKTTILLTIGQNIIQSLEEEREIVRLRELALDQVLGRSEGKVFETLISLSGKAQTQYGHLSLLPNLLQKIDTNDLSDDEENTLTAFKTALTRKRKDLASLEQFQQILPSLLAQEGKRSYLVLVQNNQELRPSGGLLVGSAIVTLEKGVVTDYQFFDTTSLDQMFQGVVSPPSEIKTYLGEKRWLLRDANWSAGFPEAARQIAWFFEKSTGRKVDGVVSMNILVLQHLLRVFGPISLPDTGEAITANNIHDKVEFHSEARFTNAAQGEYLVFLTKQFFAQLFMAPTSQALTTLGVLEDELRSGQVSIFSADASMQSVIQNLGWSGEIMAPDCPTQLHTTDSPCVVDPLYQVEANVGVNRANFSIHRSITQNIHLTPQGIQHQREVIWTNTSTSQAWPSGSYKVFARFYLPENAVFDGIMIDGVPIVDAAITKKTENGRVMVGAFAEVPVQKSTRMILKYHRAETLKNPYSYAFFDQKQPGTGEDPITIRLTHDPAFRPVLIAPQAEVKDDVITFSLQKDKHVFVGARYH